MKPIALIVVTVVKNDLESLYRTEKSLRNQTSSAKWIIVTPQDFSATYLHISSLKTEGLVTEVLHDLGTGLYSAMNLAIDFARGIDWLWFMNAGDEFADKNSMAIVNQHIFETNSRWIYGGHILASSEGKHLGVIPAPVRFSCNSQLYAKRYLSHQSVVFECGLLKELDGFRLNFKIAADWDLLVRASKITPGLRVNSLLSVFHMGGLSTRNRKTGNAELLQLRKEHLPIYDLPRSYIWFSYRSVRNWIVERVERKFPIMTDRIRSFRLTIKNKSQLTERCDK